MKLAIFGDLHLHPFTEFAHLEEGINSRLLDGCSALRTIIEEAEKERVRCIVSVGDFFHETTRINPIAQEFAIRELEKTEIPKIFLTGNHDFHGSFCGQTFTTLSGLKNVEIFDSPEVVGIGSITVLHLPFSRETDNISNWIEKAVALKKPIAVFGHLDIRGAIAGPLDKPIGQDIDPATFNHPLIKRVFLGHYHTHQEITPKIIYTGSPLQLTFGEEGHDKGFIIYDTEKDEWKFIKINQTPFKTFDIKSQQDLCLALQYIETNQVRARFKTSVRLTPEIVKSLSNLGIRIEYQVYEEKQVRLASVKSGSMKEIITEYIKITPNKPHVSDEELINRGLTYLNEV